MNLGPGLAAVTPPPPPPEPPKAPSRTSADDANAAHRKEEDFERMIQAELERKKLLADATPLPSTLMPWLPVQANSMTDEDDDAIAAANGISASDRAVARSLLSVAVVAPRPASGAKPRASTDPDDEPVAPVARKEPQENAPTPIHVVVEPNLPPVQPIHHKPGEPVPMVEFPQVVAGTARQMVKDGQAITQLDFEINPPHVGPVNLNVSVAERVVSIQLIVPNVQAKQMLESQTGQIAAILQSQNLTPGQVRIVTAAGGKSGAGATGQQSDQGGFGLLNGGRRRASGPDDMTSGSV